ncbi:MAG: hypothetical protein ATN31_08820 [Candidatus Epulonipiscioides saccharophilum]|nr:MAG: hypothetical protein ATN31_08820 [Epulopiscium sp. AS2M-Bin001]
MLHRIKACSKYDAKILETATVCPNCGIYQTEDESHFGYFIARLLLPVAGLMLYLALKDIWQNTPSRIKSGIMIFFAIPIIILLIMGLFGLLGLIIM